MDTCTCEESANEKTVSKEDQVGKEGKLAAAQTEDWTDRR